MRKQNTGQNIIMRILSQEFLGDTLKHIINMFAAIIRSKEGKYFLFAVLVLLVIPINYFIFNNTPSHAVKTAEEEVIEGVTGIDFDLNGDGE